MSTQQTNLSGELTVLADVYRELGPRLAETARNLELAGQPPAEDAIAQLQSARQRFLDCRDATLRLAAAESFPTPPGTEELAAIPDLEKLLQAIDTLCAERVKHEQQRQLLQSACAILERVAQINHKDGSELQSLRECQQQARELTKAADEGREQIGLNVYQELAAGSHPFCDLLTLIERRDEIDDVRWEELENSINRSFGKALTIAAARGKLVVGTPPRPAESAPAGKTTMLREPAAVATLPDTATPETVADSNGPVRARPDDHTEMDLALTDGAGQLPSAEEDADTFRRRAPEDVWHRSPLTAQQEAEILAPSSGIAILFGSHIAGLDDVERFLEVACQDARLITLDAAIDRSGFVHELDGLLQDRPDGMLLVVVPALAPWSEDWVLRAAEQVKRKASPKKMTRVLFVADPEAAWSWVRLDDDLRGRMRRDGLIEFSLTPWSNAALRRWLKDVGLINSDPYICERFSRVTGSWGELLHQIGDRCKNEPHDWQEYLADFERELTTRPEWEDRLGLVAQAQAVLKVMAQMTQPVSSDKIAAKMDGTPRERIDTALRWADLLSYVHRAGHQLWSLDPVVRQVVLVQGGE